eukprot:357754-Chlamydomonas_euryale.AAC.6
MHLGEDWMHGWMAGWMTHAWVQVASGLAACGLSVGSCRRFDCIISCRWVRCITGCRQISDRLAAGGLTGNPSPWYHVPPHMHAYAAAVTGLHGAACMRAARTADWPSAAWRRMHARSTDGRLAVGCMRAHACMSHVAQGNAPPLLSSLSSAFVSVPARAHGATFDPFSIKYATWAAVWASVAARGHTPPQLSTPPPFPSLLQATARTSAHSLPAHAPPLAPHDILDDAGRLLARDVDGRAASAAPPADPRGSGITWLLPAGRQTGVGCGGSWGGKWVWGVGGMGRQMGVGVGVFGAVAPGSLRRLGITWSLPRAGKGEGW